MSKKLGWIGTGVMGLPMCKNLVKAGHKISVYDKLMFKTHPVTELGALPSNPISIAKEVDHLYLMLRFPEDVEKMVLCPENGILKHMRKGSFLIDHTSSSPHFARRIAEEAKKYGVYSFDIPVAGGDLAAHDGNLSLMAGGDKEKFEEIKPYLEINSHNLRYCGEAGKGQQTKLANQIMLGHNMVGVCEAVVFAYKAKLDVKETIEYLSKGSAASTQLSVYYPRIEVRDLEPGFYAEHFLKDLKLVVEECDRIGIKLQSLELIKTMYELMCKERYQNKGHHGLLLLLERMNNLNAI